MASVLSRIQIIMEANTARYNNELRRARENSSTSFGQMGKSATKAAAVVGTALAGMGALSLKTAMSFETSMAEIDKTVDFASSNGLANMRKELQALTTQIPQTFEELAAVTATGGQLGIAEKDLVHFTEVMAKMGVAFDIPAQQAADSMAKIANVFQIPIENIDRLGDAINTLSNNTPATAAQLIDSLQRVGGVAKVFGLSEDATLGLTGALIAMGKPAEVASTAVNSLLTSFSTLDNATKSQLIGFEQLGLNIDDFSKLVATDGKQAIITYLEAINKLEQSKRIGTNALIIGKEFGDDITMLAGSVGVLENNWEMLGETVNTTKDYFGSMDVEFEKISATSANKMVLIKNNIDGVVASLGDAFIPALNELLLKMTPMVAIVGTWVSANPELIQQITLIGGSLVGTVLGLKLAVDGFTAAKTTVDGLKLAYAALGTTMGLTVLGLGILLATGALVYQNWDEIKRVVSENQPAFIALGVAVSALTVALIAANAPLILLKVQAAAAAVQAGVMTVATASWSVAAGVGAAATWTFNAALAVLTSPILAVVAAIALIAAGGYLVVKNWAAISAGLNTEFNKIKSYVLNTVATMQAAWDRGVANTRGAIINIKNTIMTTLRELPGRMLQVGRDIVNGLINGIKQGASGVATAIGSMASSAVAKAKSVLDIRSPSRVMKKVGEQTAEGMAVGIKKGKKAVVTEAQRMAQQAIQAVEDGINSFRKRVALFGDNSELSSLLYDINNGKYKGASDARINEYVKQATALQHLESQLKATNAVQKRFDEWQGQRDKLRSGATNLIRGRFDQFGKDKISAGENLQSMLSGLESSTPMGKIQAEYDARNKIIEQYEQTHTDMVETANNARIASDQAYMDAKRDLMLTQNEALFGDLAGFAKSFVGEQSGIYRALFAVEKGFAIAQSAMAIQQSVAKAMAVGFPQNIPIIGQAVMQGAEIVSNIKSISMPVGQAHDGIASVPREGTWVLDKNERVVKADDNKKLSQFLDSGASKGGDVNVNVTVNGNGTSSVEADQKTGKQLGQAIAAAVKQQLMKERRQGGILYGR
ncbi:phage tail tape measure protein [Psychrobacter sp. AOP7-C1-14]|uniref:phage tail tape measure protein n=1 Tax=Psychrobacter sp. AOP7-C1-14 TaxID=3457640 RepID=UPI00402BE22F